MSDDWKPGDLAWAVRDGRFGVIRKGATYLVNEVFTHRATRELCLGVDEVPTFVPPLYYGHRACLFRKINPLTDAERDEFLTDLKAPSPSVVEGGV